MNAAQAEKPKVLDSAAIGGGQDKFRIVGKVNGQEYEVGPYDTVTRAEQQAEKLKPVSDEDAQPKILVILTCSSVDAMLRKFKKPETKPAVKSEDGKAEAKSEAKTEEPKAETKTEPAKDDNKGGQHAHQTGHRR